MQRLYPECKRKVSKMDKQFLEKYLEYEVNYNCEYGEAAKELVRYVHGKCFSTDCQKECKGCRWDQIRSSIKTADVTGGIISLELASVFIAESAIATVARADKRNAVVRENLVFKNKFDTSHVSAFYGADHCRCNGNGEFVLLKKENSKENSKEKQYMRCRKCGCYTH